MMKCKNADKYKALRPPKCNNGDPCRTCQAKWANVAADAKAAATRERWAHVKGVYVG